MILRCFSAAVFLLQGCAQNVHVKSTSAISKVVIDDYVISDIGPTGKEAILPIRFGPASYQIFQNDELILEGELPRTQVSPLVFGLAVGGAVVFTPTLAISAAILVNPSWIFASSVFVNGGGASSFWAYFAQTASFWTLPAIFLGAAIGLLPLVGLAYSERLPDVVLIATPESMRR